MGPKESSFEQKPSFEADKDGFVNFGDVSRQILKKQGQYGVAYAFGDESCDCPNLGDGLRILGNPGNYCDVKIHKDDIDEFVRRYKAYQEERRS
ncbi:MAG: hypothetical protein WC928_01225 [Patescibacteria group bacterium]|jgi:hypothetical protein